MLSLLPLFGYLFLGSVAGLSGGLLLIWKEKLIKGFSIHLISFAAGVILATAFLDLLPEAVEKGGEGTFLLILIGLVIFFLVEDLLLHFHHHEEHQHRLSSVVPLLVTSDTIHNFIDGVAITASFLANPALGFVVSLATFFHEIPQEIGDFAVLLSAGVSKKKVVIYNLLSALATFVGAFLTLALAKSTNNLIGPLLGLTTGMFLYISSADILPELVRGERKNLRWHTAGFFLAGITLVIFLTKFLPE